MESHLPVWPEWSCLSVVLCTWNTAFVCTRSWSLLVTELGYAKLPLLLMFIYECLKDSFFFTVHLWLRLGLRLPRYLKNLRCGPWVNHPFGDIILAQCTTWATLSSCNSSSLIPFLVTPVSKVCLVIAISVSYPVLTVSRGEKMFWTKDLEEILSLETWTPISKVIPCFTFEIVSFLLQLQVTEQKHHLTMYELQLRI